jgi:hypothetical protein
MQTKQRLLIPRKILVRVSAYDPLLCRDRNYFLP